MIRVGSGSIRKRSFWIGLSVVDENLDEPAVIQQRADQAAVMKAADHPGKELGDVRLDVPLFIQQIAAVRLAFVPMIR